MKFIDKYYIEKCGMDKYVEHRLTQWARWYRHQDYAHLGYPKESLESRHLTNGGVVHPNRGPKPLPCNPVAEDLERIITMMRQQEEKSSNALCQEYLNSAEQSYKARALGVSLAQFKIQVALGRQWLKGWFHANYSKSVNSSDGFSSSFVQEDFTVELNSKIVK